MDDLEVLRREFEAEDGSFLLRLRGDLHWDRQAFGRLERAMRRVCARYEAEERLDRWLVDGYWFLADFVPGWTGHPNFPRPEPEYYEAALERLHDLQNWFVTGRSPYTDTHVWPDL
ncbi:hypothetical protein [Streptosporangium saharense]|uniref:hypothetical protein n=1 Tax=Streptosporangium saharense TaxID=1706840 RepID=UPI0036A9012B